MSCTTITNTINNSIGGASTEAASPAAAAATSTTTTPNHRIKSRIGTRINIIVLLSLSVTARYSSGLVAAFAPSSSIFLPTSSFRRRSQSSIAVVVVGRSNYNNNNIHNREQFHHRLFARQHSGGVKNNQDRHHRHHHRRHHHHHHYHHNPSFCFGHSTTSRLYSIQSQFLDDDDDDSSSSRPGPDSRLESNINNNSNYSNAGFIDFDDDDDDDDDDQAAKWERMYQEGEKAKQETMAGLLQSSNNYDVDVAATAAAAAASTSAATTTTTTYSTAGASTSQLPSTPVKVVTFDLDNTLWKTGPSISAANDALNTFLETHPRRPQIRITKRVEVYMKQLFESDPAKYAPVPSSSSSSSSSSSATSDGKTRPPPLPPSPVLLTKLRTDAIAYLLERDNSFSPSEATELAKEAFEVWTDARHDACLDHMAPGVVETLEKIRNMNDDNSSRIVSTDEATSADGSRTSDRSRKVIIGAITDGNSDPRKIRTLEKYFDFVINAESVGTSKPDKRVYIEAGRTVLTNFLRMKQQSDGDIVTTLSSTSSELGVVTSKSRKKVQPGTEDDDDDDDDDDDGGSIDDADSALVESLLGPYWCHIGDDFLKDIVAAKNLGMRTIWSIGLVKEKLLKKVSGATSATSGQKTATTEPSGDKSGTEMDILEFINKVSSQSVVTMGIGADDYLASSLTGEFVDAIADDFVDIGRILSDWNIASEAPTMETGQDRETATATALSNNDLPVATVAKNNRQRKDGIDQNSEGDQTSSLDFIIPRAFRIVREDCEMNVPAPLRERDVRTMQDVLRMAQMDKSSGVFAFDPQDVAATKEGTKALMIRIGDTGLEFSREIFTSMTVDEVLSMSPENPLSLTMYMKDAVKADSFDLF